MPKLPLWFCLPPSLVRSKQTKKKKIKLQKIATKNYTPIFARHKHGFYISYMLAMFFFGTK